MKITSKEYRTVQPVERIIENDVQGGYTKSILNIFIYIYNNLIVEKFVTDYNSEEPNKIFGQLTEEMTKNRRKNLDESIEVGKQSVSTGTYNLLKNNKIEMKWNYYHGEEIETVFKGEILLNGDAIKGIFYKNGIEDVSERLYFNIDKPLPKNLTEEENNA